MSSIVEPVGSLYGKSVLLTTDSAQTTIEQLRQHLSKFNLAWMLRHLGGLSTAASEAANRFVSLAGVPVAAHAIPHVALVAVEESSDDVAAIPTERDTAEAFRIYNGISDPRLGSTADGRVYEFLLREGFAQLAGRVEFHALIARTWILYDRVWSTVDRARGFDVKAAIAAETGGLSLEQALCLGFACVAHGSSGYWSAEYSADGLADLPPELGIGPEQQAQFLRWVTGSYEDIRRLAARQERRDRYVLSPFLIYPVVQPHRPPQADAERVRLVPVPSYLAARVTSGIYHALATRNDAGGGENVFRRAFGHVLERYVGNLLVAGSGSATVLPELDYGPKKRRSKSPDWLVLDGERLLVVEVKLSALRFNTKVIGDLKAVAEDLERTLTYGATQLVKFREAVLARQSGLEVLGVATRVELLLVVQDDVPFANSVLRRVIAAKALQAADVHICSVADFEGLQRFCWGQSPFELLQAKRLSPAAHEKDVHDWLVTLGQSAVPPHPVLDEAFNWLVGRWLRGRAS